jgi:hypothetical protein
MNKDRLYYPRRGEGGFIITSMIVLVVVDFVCLAASFWDAEKQKAYYDAELNRLCAIDGGVNVYETVRLPPERFDQHGNVNLPSREKAKPSDEYFYVFEPDTYIRNEGENLVMRRSSAKYIRRSDGKVLGESVSYHRIGGDSPFNPGHPSSHRCPPNPFKLNPARAIFLKETAE